MRRLSAMLIVAGLAVLTLHLIPDAWARSARARAEDQVFKDADSRGGAAVQVDVHTSSGSASGGVAEDEKVPDRARRRGRKEDPKKGKNKKAKPKTRAYQVQMPALYYCYPKPPKLSEIKVKVHLRAGVGAFTIDSTPKTCDTKFCNKAGFRGRRCCPLGPEGTNSRKACEAMALGKDPTDGVDGPRWFFQGPGKVEKRPDNPYLATVTFEKGGDGKVWACSNREKVCGSTMVSW